MSTETKVKLDIDSNIFRNQAFINWLILKKEEMSIELSIIVYLETLFFYLTRSLTIEDFENDLTDISAKIITLDKILAQNTTKNALKSKLPFKHHARDFIIGSAALKRGSILLSYNTRHFNWMPKGSILTPEMFLETMME